MARVCITSVAAQISDVNESPVLLLMDPSVDAAKHKDLPVTLYESGEPQSLLKLCGTSL